MERRKEEERKEMERRKEEERREMERRQEEERQQLERKREAIVFSHYLVHTQASFSHVQSGGDHLSAVALELPWCVRLDFLLFELVTDLQHHKFGVVVLLRRAHWAVGHRVLSAAPGHPEQIRHSISRGRPQRFPLSLFIQAMRTLCMPAAGEERTAGSWQQL